MVMSAVIYRAANSAARSITGARRIHQSVPSASHFRRASNGFNRILCKPHYIESTTCLSRFEQRFCFSSVSGNKGSDSELIKIIQSEIKYAKESDDHDRVEETPEGFPFEIQDEEGTNIILLKRSYEDEQIEVRVSMPSLVTGEDPEDDRDADDDNNDDDNDEEPIQSYIPLTVIINKGQGPSLEFHCTAHAEKVVIDAMSVREVSGEEEMLPYEGPDFSDLDEDLQGAFYKYLEQRGISAMTTAFLHEYMINKDSREYLLWLKNLKKFVEK